MSCSISLKRPLPKPCVRWHQKIRLQRQPIFSQRVLRLQRCGSAAGSEDFAGDAFIAYSTWAWLEAQVKTVPLRCIAIVSIWVRPAIRFHPASIGAFHSDDIEYVFGTLDSRQGAKWRPEDYKLSELMQNLLDEFCQDRRPQRCRPSGMAHVQPDRKMAGHALVGEFRGATGPASRQISVSAAGLGPGCTLGTTACGTG